MRCTHATKMKFNTHVFWTLIFEFVKKKLYFKFASMENEFFSRTVHWPVREPNAALDLARHCTCLNAFALTSTSVKCISFRFWRFFFYFWFSWKEKKFVFHTRELKYNFFFTNSKVKVHDTCVLNFISVACVERIKIPIVYKIVIKNIIIIIVVFTPGCISSGTLSFRNCISAPPAVS